MIKVYVRFEGESVWFNVTGHANYAEEGKDIVCAGVSALTNCLANMVYAFREDGLAHDCRMAPEDAPSYITATTSDRAVMAALRTIAMCYVQMAEQYPEHISIMA